MVGARDIAALMERMNNYPRLILGWKTLNFRFDEELAKLKGKAA
jgi:IS30 family transposase